MVHLGGGARRPRNVGAHRSANQQAACRGDESRDEEQDYGTLHRRNRKAEGVLEAS